MISGMQLSVRGDPWDWPLGGPCHPSGAALLVIDMQGDFVRNDGWLGWLHADLSGIQTIVPTLARLLQAARGVPGLAVIHTRQGNAPDLSDLPTVKQEQGTRAGSPIGRPGPIGRGLIRGEEGWQIIPELTPEPGELVVDKPGYGAFVGTTLEGWLREHGIRALILTGVTANVCVLATLYGAVDRGFDCLVVSDAVAAVTPEASQTLVDLVRYQRGLFGSVASADTIIEAMAPGLLT